MKDAPEPRPRSTPSSRAVGAPSRRRPRVRLTLFRPDGRALSVEAPADLAANDEPPAQATLPPMAPLRSIGPDGRPRPCPPRVEAAPPWATQPSVLMPPGLRTMGDTLDEVLDMPAPLGPENPVEAAIALLRSAAQSERVSARGDAILVALEHAAQALAELFDRETARRHLNAITARL